jgi:hypothetical protein
MMRIRMDAMSKKDGLYVYQGQLFSGVGFAIEDRRVVTSFQIESGVVVDPYLPGELTTSAGLRQRDITGLFSEDENCPYPLEHLMQGGLLEHEGVDGDFSGVGYEFSGNHCIHETLFKNGLVAYDRWWLTNGLMRSLTIYDEIQHEYRWSISGVLEHVRIRCGELFYGYFAFDDDGKLKSLNLEGDFFSHLSEIVDRTDFFPIKDIQGFGALKCAPSLSLGGNRVDNNILGLMADSGVLEEAGELSIYDSTIDIDSVSILVNLKNLKSLSLSLPTNDSQQHIVEEVKMQRPDVAAQFVPKR